MKFQKTFPPEILRNDVRYFWSLESGSVGNSDLIIESFADRFPRLIFQNLDGYQAIRTQKGVILPATYLSGIDTRNSSYHLKERFSHVGISFYPHALKYFFNLDACESINQLIDLSHFCPGDLSDKLHDASGFNDRIKILAEFLIGRKRDYDQNSIIKDCLFSPKTNWGISEWLKRYNISERQLERKFKTHVGVSPKAYLRIVRFEKALEALNSNQTKSPLDIAFNLQYADHSHFIREFKEFSGLTPAKFVSKDKLSEESSSFVTPGFK